MEPARSPIATSNTARAGVWHLANGRAIGLDRPRLLAILNITPDSFSDGGQFLDPRAALDRAERAAEEGADMLDIGGESTRPGAAPVPPDEQVRRVVPVISAIRASRGRAAGLPISVDTTRSEVVRAALGVGADAVNDQSAGNDEPVMLALVAAHGAGMVLMHRRRAPERDRYSNQYPGEPDYRPSGVVAAVSSFLKARADAALAAGVGRSCIVLDPGLGFGKSVAQNQALLDATPGLMSLGFPLLCAVSRKSFIGAMMAGPGQTVPPPAERISGSVAAAVAQFGMGTRLFRVHDVGVHRAALDGLNTIGHVPT